MVHGKKRSISDSTVDAYIHKVIRRKRNVNNETEFEELVKEYEFELWNEGANFDQLVRFRCEVAEGGFKEENHA